jgi:hypothetical protein
VQIGTVVRMRSAPGASEALSPGFSTCLGAIEGAALHQFAILAVQSIRDPSRSARDGLWRASQVGVIPAPNVWRGRGRLRGA